MLKSGKLTCNHRRTPQPASLYSTIAEPGGAVSKDAVTVTRYLSEHTTRDWLVKGVIATAVPAIAGGLIKALLEHDELRGRPVTDGATVETLVLDILSEWKTELQTRL